MEVLGLSFDTVGKMLLILGGVIILLGLVLLLAGKVPFLGRLPGDIHVQTDGFTCFFPIASMVIMSLILTILINVIMRLLSK